MSGLTSAEVGRFRERGYLADLPLLSEEETASYRAQIEEVVAACEPCLHNHILQVHTVLPWAYTLATRRDVLDRVESLLGPDLLLWKSKCFVKFPGSATVPWHQDMPHWDLETPTSVTAWIALTASHAGNGCVSVVPGSHRRGTMAHAVDKAGDSLLTSGMNISPPEDADTHRVTLPAGEMSLHDGYIVHGSDANTSEEPRIGVAFVFIAASARQRGAAHPGVMLVRGHDRAEFFPLTAPPAPGEAVMSRARTAFTSFHQGSGTY